MLFVRLITPPPQSFPFPTFLLSQPRGCLCEPRDAQGQAHLIPLKVQAKEMRPKSPPSLLFLSALPPFYSRFSPIYTGFRPYSSARGCGSCPAEVPPLRGRAAPQPEPGALPGLVNLPAARKFWQL